MLIADSSGGLGPALNLWVPPNIHLSGQSGLRSENLANTLTGNASNIQIHESCKPYEQRQLVKALGDLYEISALARDYAIDHGPSMNRSDSDGTYNLYFGNSQTDTVVGAFEWLISGNKTGMILRCDDPSEICLTQDVWDATQWKLEEESNTTNLETVICPQTFETRRPLEQFCAFNYTVAGNETPNVEYFGIDLMHRLLHVLINSGSNSSSADIQYGYYADLYEDCLQLASENGEKAAFNSHNLQYFAADVYGRTVAYPGIGCTGKNSGG
ncbi:Prenylated Rab acceptor protein 1 [Stygiomarasmius scandens]|uniref:Prenylated Rab acceptor protein 1 n=1 Tax=Marasmiellus scandens TaxID=2682957 RepID=A0ABR1J9L5_9AGAR